LWSQGHEPGRDVVALGVAGVLTLALADVLLLGRLGLFFDLCFITLCLVLALRVAPGEFFVVGVLPPLILLGAMVVLAIGQPGAIARPDDSTVQAVVSGLATHATALLAGYAVALAVLVKRTRALTRG
jgi:hypothetical protein